MGEPQEAAEEIMVVVLTNEVVTDNNNLTVTVKLNQAMEAVVTTHTVKIQELQNLVMETKTLHLEVIQITVHQSNHLLRILTQKQRRKDLSSVIIRSTCLSPSCQRELNYSSPFYSAILKTV